MEVATSRAWRSQWVSGFSRGFNLSTRQETALLLLVEGKSVKHMALELSISQVTARRHAEELYRKCGTRNQRELLALVTRTLLQEVFFLAGRRVHPAGTAPDDTQRKLA